MVAPKKVSFHDVEVREYPTVPSLNPSTHYGPAIEIGWEYRLASELPPLKTDPQSNTKGQLKLEDGHVTVSDYERVRPSALRRRTKELYLFVNQREYFIKTNNFTNDEIKSFKKQKDALYKQRERSKRQSPMMGCKESILHIRRNKKIKRAVRNLNKGDLNHHSDTAETLYRGWWIPLSAYMF